MIASRPHYKPKGAIQPREERCALYIRDKAFRAILSSYRQIMWVEANKLTEHQVAVAGLELGVRVPSGVWTIRSLAKWCADQGVGKREAIVFFLRYHLDDAFRAKQITRAHGRNARRRDLQLLGAISPQETRQLFAVKDCLYCGHAMRSQDKTLDHIWPVSLGGLHLASNCVVVCRSCNTSKRGLAPDAWLTRLPPERRAVVRAHYQRLGIWGRRAA